MTLLETAQDDNNPNWWNKFDQWRHNANLLGAAWPEYPDEKNGRDRGGDVVGHFLYVEEELAALELLDNRDPRDTDPDQ